MLDDIAFIDLKSLPENTDRDFSFYYIDISSVSEGRITFPTQKTLFREAPSRARKIVHRHDVLMSTVRPNLKAFAYFNHTDEDCIASTGFSILTSRPEVDPRFILYAILSESVTAQIEAQIVGSNYPAINSGTLRGLKVLVPPFPEQAKIAEILSTVDRAIEQTEALIAKQQRIKTGLMQDLLTRGIDEQGNLRSEKTHEFKDSPLGRIPVEWEVEQLDKVLAKKQYGVSTRLSDEPIGNPVLRMNNLVNGEVDYGDVKYLASKCAANLILDDGDVLFNRTNSIDYVGRTGIFRYSGRPISFASYLVRLVTDKERLCPEYLNYWLNDSVNQITVKQLATIGVQQANINPTNLGMLPIAFPKATSEQKQIIAAIATSANHIRDINDGLQKLRSLKTALMQDLLTGKVRVTSLLRHSAY
jgi:type I restriction enzyme S subunit